MMISSDHIIGNVTVDSVQRLVMIMGVKCKSVTVIYYTK